MNAAAVGTIMGLLLSSLATASQAQGRVSAVSGQQLTLSVGTREGIVVGQTGRVRQIRGVRDRIVTIEVAAFRVTHVLESTSVAEITSLEPGARVGVGNQVTLDPPAEPPPASLTEPERDAEPEPEPEPGPDPAAQPERPTGRTESRPRPARATQDAPADARPPAATADDAPPVQVGGAIKPPRRTKTVAPVYPEAARNARVEGVVVLECTISPQGKVRKIVVLRSVPLLDEAAADAVEQWEWEPTIVNGVPVPVTMTVTVNFSLS